MPLSNVQRWFWTKQRNRILVDLISKIGFKKLKNRKTDRTVGLNFVRSVFLFFRFLFDSLELVDFVVQQVDFQ